MGSDNNFPASDLTREIETQQRDQLELSSKLTSLQGDLNSFLNLNSISNIDNNQYQTISAEFNDTIIPLINSFTTNGNQISNNILNSNEKLNSSLGQITSNYMLNKKISSKTLDNITAQNEQLTQEVNNKSRMTEINNYFSNMNTYLILVMRNIAIVIAIMIVFIALSNIKYEYIFDISYEKYSNSNCYHDCIYSSI